MDIDIMFVSTRPPSIRIRGMQGSRLVSEIGLTSPIPVGGKRLRLRLGIERVTQLHSVQPQARKQCWRKQLRLACIEVDLLL